MTFLYNSLALVSLSICVSQQQKGSLMVLQVPLLLCPIFGPMIDCWHQVKLEMLVAVIVLLNACIVFITKVRLLLFSHLEIYDPNLPLKQFHLDIPLNFIATIDCVELQHSALETVIHLFFFSQQRQQSDESLS